MNHFRIGSAVMLVAAGLIVTPALAQNTNTNANDTAPAASSGTASVAHNTASQRNPVLADNGDSRASKVVGSAVYSGQDKKLGSIDDILLGQGGANPMAVVSADGRLVLVPYGKLEFGNTKESSDNRVILPDETAGSLKKLPEFHYAKGGK